MNKQTIQILPEKNEHHVSAKICSEKFITYQYKNIIYAFLGVGVCLITTAFFFVWHTNIRFFHLTSSHSHPLVSMRAQDSQPSLASSIPAYYVSAHLQILQATPLRRAELVLLNEEDDVSDADLAVIDKVVVAPKVLPQPIVKVA